MKKFWLLWLLLLVIFVTGCSWFWKKEAETNTKKADLDVESCNKYFELVNCIIDNDIDDSYSEEDREVIREGVNDMRNDWIGLDDETLDNMCSTELNKFRGEEMAQYLSNINCSLD